VLLEEQAERASTGRTRARVFSLMTGASMDHLLDAAASADLPVIFSIDG
jgi:hypothetical protein